MEDKLKAELHSIALNNHVRDEVAKQIVESPFMFMKEIIEDLDLDKLDKVNFYHKGFGRFYLKEDVLKKIKEIIKRKDEKH